MKCQIAEVLEAAKDVVWKVMCRPGEYTVWMVFVHCRCEFPRYA